MRIVLAAVSALIVVASMYAAGQPQGSPAGLPMPALHHIHINSVNPAASLA